MVWICINSGVEMLNINADVCAVLCCAVGTGFLYSLAAYLPCVSWGIYLVATCCTTSAGTG